jgi:hypothetical protein
MKTLKIYRTRKKLLILVLLIWIIILVAYIVNEDWNDPNWLLMLSLTFNGFGALGVFITSYKNTKILLCKDKIIYRLAAQKKDETIAISGESLFSKDWKGIYVKNEADLNMISLNYINNKNGERIFQDIKDFYNKR